MKRKASALLIGSFVVGGLALLAVTLMVLAGDKLFTRKERAVMHFSGSLYGLQVGAPVVFRGVRVGSVVSIGVFYERASDTFTIPVLAELDGDAVSGLDGRPATEDVSLALPALVERGLSAQLSMQSLLTGLLYVDLDLRPRRVSTLRGTYRDPSVVEIPTTATAIQALKDQLEGMDFRRLADDVSAIAASARAVVSGPELGRALADVAEITASVRHLTKRLDLRVDPLANELQGTLVAARSAAQQLGQTAQGLDRQAERFGVASDRMANLLAPESALVLKLQQSADEVARSASSLRQATAKDSSLLVGTENALQDLSRAARALRDLAETLEQQPESLLRGREAVR
jgi:paraquat-inducible protein B